MPRDRRYVFEIPTDEEKRLEPEESVVSEILENIGLRGEVALKVEKRLVNGELAEKGIRVLSYSPPNTVELIVRVTETGVEPSCSYLCRLEIVRFFGVHETCWMNEFSKLVLAHSTKGVIVIRENLNGRPAQRKEVTWWADTFDALVPELTAGASDKCEIKGRDIGRIVRAFYLKRGINLTTKQYLTVRDRLRKRRVLVHTRGPKRGFESYFMVNPPETNRGNDRVTGVRAAAHEVVDNIARSLHELVDLLTQ